MMRLPRIPPTDQGSSAPSRSGLGDHHEPMFTRHLQVDYHSILTLAGWICPKTRDWIAHHSRVESLLPAPKDAPDMAF